MFLVKLCGLIGAAVSIAILINHLTSRTETSITAIPLSQIKGIEKQYNPNTLGGLPRNQRYLVADVAENQELWEHIYKTKFLPRRYIGSQSQSSHFWKVNKGYGEDRFALNKVCSSAYSLRFVELDVYRDWIKSDLKTYCTISGQHNTLNFGNEE